MSYQATARKSLALALLESDMNPILTCKCGDASTFLCPRCHKGICAKCILRCPIGDCREWICAPCLMAHVNTHSLALSPPAGEPAQAISGQPLSTSRNSDCDAGPVSWVRCGFESKTGEPLVLILEPPVNLPGRGHLELSCNDDDDTAIVRVFDGEGNLSEVRPECVIVRTGTEIRVVQARENA